VWAPDWPDRPALRFRASIDSTGELRAMLEGEFFHLVNEVQLVGRLLIHPGIRNARAVSEEFGFNEEARSSRDQCTLRHPWAPLPVQPCQVCGRDLAGHRCHSSNPSTSFQPIVSRPTAG
jgi:hypothetical protein